MTKEEEIGLKKNRRAVDIREEYFVRPPPPLWISLPLMLPLFALPLTVCSHSASRLKTRTTTGSPFEYLGLPALRNGVFRHHQRDNYGPYKHFNHWRDTFLIITALVFHVFHCTIIGARQCM